MVCAVIQTPLGHVRIEAENGAVEAVLFTEEELIPAKDELLQRAEKQLQEYFAGDRQEFDLPIRMKGTAFQLAVWRVLQGIPYGQTITYGEEAERLGNKNAARAVGGANHINPICIVVPCHRVVAANGPGGYGPGVEKKEYLLALERKYARRNE